MRRSVSTWSLAPRSVNKVAGTAHRSNPTARTPPPEARQVAGWAGRGVDAKATERTRVRTRSAPTCGGVCLLPDRPATSRPGSSDLSRSPGRGRQSACRRVSRFGRPPIARITMPARTTSMPTVLASGGIWPKKATSNRTTRRALEPVIAVAGPAGPRDTETPGPIAAALVARLFLALGRLASRRPRTSAAP